MTTNQQTTPDRMVSVEHLAIVRSFGKRYSIFAGDTQDTVIVFTHESRAGTSKRSVEPRSKWQKHFAK